MSFFDSAGGVASMIGGNIASTILTNNRSRRDAERMMGWQERMSGSAHQREVADLKAAGLNPILSANAGANSSGGAMPELSAPSIDLPMVYKNRELGQIDTKLAQDQQRINIEKASATAGIAKNLSDAELAKANRLATEGGIGTKFLGTKTYEQLNRPIFDKKSYSPLKSNQPSNLNPHKGLK